MTDRPPKTAIATIWDGNERLACGMPLWCQGARTLARQIPRSEIVLLAQQPSVDCPEATLEWSDETAAAAAAFVASHTLRDAEVQTALLKFAMFSFWRFDLVLQVDLDADLVPSYHPFRLDVWTRHVQAFMSSDFLFVGVPDHSSPVNGGLWLAKPRRWLYRESLALLRNCSFSFERGFNGVGAPRSIFATAQKKAAAQKKDEPVPEAPEAPEAAELQVDMGALRLGAGGGRYADDLVLRTEMFTRNDWKFTGGSLDQGLLFYLIYLRHRRGTWATSASMANRRDLWKERRPAVSHFWGPFKPWRHSGKARADYLKRLGAALPNVSATLAEVGVQSWPSGVTPCVKELCALREALRGEGEWDANDKLGWIPHEMPVLPALSIAGARLLPPPPPPYALRSSSRKGARAARALPPPPNPYPPAPLPPPRGHGVGAAHASSQSTLSLPVWPVATAGLLLVGCAVRRRATGHRPRQSLYAPLPQHEL